MFNVYFHSVWYTLFCTLDIIMGIGTRVFKKFHMGFLLYQFYYSIPLTYREVNFLLLLLCKSKCMLWYPSSIMSHICR